MSEPKHLTELMEVVYPTGRGVVAMVMGTEKKIIKDATARIKELENRAEKLRELLGDARVALLYSDKGMRKTLASLISTELGNPADGA